MQVMTATGPIPAAELGRVLVHEHIVISLPGETLDPAYAPDRAEIRATAIDRLQELRAHGVGAIVDPCPIELGRDPELYAEVSHHAGVKIIFATGFYFEALGIPPYWRAREAEEIADFYLHELTRGVGRTGIRPGIIKAATGNEVTPLERKVLTAAARAQAQSGVAIITHTEHSLHGDTQQQIFAQNGVDPSRILIGHQDEQATTAPIRALIANGGFIGMDRVGTRLAPDERRADFVAELVHDGLTRQICLSQDCMCAMTAPKFPFALSGGLKLDPAAYLARNKPLTYVLTDFAAMLRDRGVTDADLDIIFRDNPSRLLTGAAPVAPA